jgi:Domain of unknown function (DUF397)
MRHGTDRGQGWRKSSYSGSGNNCVEVAAAWRKSSRSSGNGACVEVAAARPVVAVRDSKDPGGPRLAFGPERWRAFTRRIKRNTP